MLATCLPAQLEAGYSARSLGDFDELMNKLFGSWKVLPVRADLGARSLGLQRALFVAGVGRAAGAFDIQVAGFALAETLAGSPTVVVHYDNDFEQLQKVEPRLLTRWVVPRGSVD